MPLQSGQLPSSSGVGEPNECAGRSFGQTMPLDDWHRRFEIDVDAVAGAEFSDGVGRWLSRAESSRKSRSKSPGEMISKTRTESSPAPERVPLASRLREQ